MAKSYLMALEVTNTDPRRRWQDVRTERDIPLRVLGQLVGKTDSTMQAYSIGRRPVPKEVLWRMSIIFGEDVR